VLTARRGEDKANYMGRHGVTLWAKIQGNSPDSAGTVVGAPRARRKIFVRVILFDVEHGFCAFIRTPHHHTILIDCGKGPNFSPTEYLLQNGIHAPISKLIVSHAHEDHIEDFPRVSARLNPNILCGHNLNWDFIKQEMGVILHRSLDAYVAGRNTKFNGGPVADPDYGMYLRTFSLEPQQAWQISGGSINSALNNCSLVTVASFPGTQYTPKFVFGGDMEEAGWNELLNTNAAFRDAVRGTWYYFAAHHGHTSGFSTKLFDAMGKPFLNLVSVRHRDESRDSRYSADDFSYGWPVGGEQRKMMSTTCDGSIFFDIDPTGLPYIYTRFLPDNLQSRKPVAPVSLQDLLGGFR
jgi:beta-lactamase superfamily II metal-dependent hydrolase